MWFTYENNEKNEDVQIHMYIHKNHALFEIEIELFKANNTLLANLIMKYLACRLFCFWKQPNHIYICIEYIRNYELLLNINLLPNNNVNFLC